MPEILTFATYSPQEHGPEGIAHIGYDTGTKTGVVQEMAQAFGHELSATPDVDNFGELIGKVGPAKELQENIERVQDILGTDQDAVSIAQGWVVRSGLLLPVERTYVGGDTRPHVQYGLGVITGGVRNWMNRRADIAIEQLPSWDVTLVAGNRVMKTSEGSDVIEGMTEADYMREVIATKLAEYGIAAHLVEVDSGVGDEVMAAGAAAIVDEIDIEHEDASMVVLSNAGAWVQNAGQFRRALRNLQPGFDANGNQLSVVSDGFPLGSGTEPTSTHQNPFSALGQIVRNAQELTRHL